jgi:hypothetical protein
MWERGPEPANHRFINDVINIHAAQVAHSSSKASFPFGENSGGETHC